MTVNHPPPPAEDIDPERRLYTAAEVLEVALEGYQRGLLAGRAAASRDRWRDLAVADSFRSARARTEVTAMKRWAQDRYAARGYTTGYDYRGGPVDWDSGLPDGSGCAYLRLLRTQNAYGLARGAQ